MWVLINILFVVVMTPPRKPRKPDGSNSAGLAPVPVDQNSHHFADEDDPASMRHSIIAVALGVFFSLTPPLIDAADLIKQLIKKRRKANNSSDKDTD